MIKIVEMGIVVIITMMMMMMMMMIAINTFVRNDTLKDAHDILTSVFRQGESGSEVNGILDHIIS